MKGEREKVAAWAKEMGWGAPGQMYKAIYTALVVQHKLSLIMREMDETVDRIMLLNDRIDIAIEEGNIVAYAMLKERKDEEKLKLARYERLLDKEGPAPRKAKKDDITPDMVARTKDHPWESLLPEPLKKGRCRCPIHTGKNTMSFSVKNNRGKCWSCGWEGDQIQFIMDTQGKTFLESVRYLQ